LECTSRPAAESLTPTREPVYRPPMTSRSTRTIARDAEDLRWILAVAVLAVGCAPAEPPSGGAVETAAVPPVLAEREGTGARAATRVPLTAVGDYEANGDTLIIRERDGRLDALIRGEVHPLAPAEDGALRLGGDGPAAGAALRLGYPADARSSQRATTATLGDVVYRRLAYSDPTGETFRIEPVRPVAALRSEARSATPPLEENHFRTPDLVDLATLDPSIRFDIRYATTDNFMGAVFYDEARAFLQRPAAEAMLQVHHRLRARGFGLLVFDAYRPWYVTWMFWRATPDALKMFVANPAAGSRHNRGAAVDVTLYHLATGEPVRMPSGYDEFSPRAYPDYPGGTTVERGHRDLLRGFMEAEGFRVYHAEWWHFDHADWRRYPILNVTFDQIDTR
jgi:D-alanyl-D-alanine dipeptidase